MVKVILKIDFVIDKTLVQSLIKSKIAIGN